MPDTHFEPFVHLVDVTAERALIAWGGFWFRRDDAAGRWQVLADSRLGDVDSGRTAGMGARSEPYGDALVEVLDTTGQVVASGGTDTVNHLWVDGLAADTEYRYRITVDGRPWAEGPRLDWGPVPRGGLGLRPEGGPTHSASARTRRRTCPHPSSSRCSATTGSGS